MSNEIKDNEDIHSKVEINEIIEPTIANDKQDTESIPLSDANDEQEQPSAVEVEVPNGESISLSETNNEQEEPSAVVEISNEESQKEESQKEELISDDNPVITSAPSEQINEIQENNIVVEVESTHVDTDRSEQTPQLLQTIANQSNKEASSTILNTLVEGDFDLDKNYIIQKPVNLTELFTIFNQMSSSLQAEILSVLIGIMRKSERNLLASNDAQIYDKVLILLNEIDDDVVADLLVDILTVLTTLTINVNQLKLLLQYLKTEDRIWKKHAVKLLQIFKTLPYRYGPDDFFNFSGRNNSGIILPPIKTWPYQNGFTISTWFRIDPVANGVIEKEKPYLYSFCTSKGHGYTAHFVGHCLVITYSKLKEKTFQHCIQYEFKAREWYMITFAHQYQRWSKSSIHCYINGQSVSTTNFPWSIESGDVFDKCYIGCTHDRNDLTSFSGQLSTFYLFSFYLEPLIVQGLYRLGPAYKNQFKFENESAHVLSEAQRKAMYDGKLMNSIVFNYNPIACEGQLVLQAAPKTNVSHFVHTAHAQMLPNVRSVLTHSIYSTLHSVGGIQVFYPLFGQLDHQQTDQSINYNVCSILLTALCDLIERSYTIQHQMLNSKGFLAIGYHLEKASKQHINMDVLNSLISLTTFFVKVQNKNSPLLLKQLFVHIFFNPAIWIYCSVDVQMRLYTYLATEFVTYSEIYHLIQPISGIVQTLHTIKYFYWIVDPSNRSGFEPKALDGNRPTREQIIEMRRFMLLYLKQLVISSAGSQEEELQAILNYLHTVHEDENLLDVLDTTVNLMSEHPKTMVPAFDRRQGLRTVFKLLASASETIRLQALKLFGFFLQRSTLKRKTDTMQPHNLFSLLSDRLLLHPNGFTMATYNVLFEILVEKVGSLFVEKRSSEITSEWKIENPSMIKVIATLLRNSPDNIHLYDIKLHFLDDLILLSSASRENRRIILQMSVWQDYLLNITYVYPQSEIQKEITDRIFDLFKILLHHAIKYEYGGWRVWIDTLAILHGRVTKEDYYRKVNKLVETMKDEDENAAVASGADSPTDEQSASTPTKSSSNRQVFKANQLPPFTISEFRYSPLHIRLLHNVFDAIETDIQFWRSDATKPITEYINHVDNQIFCSNVIHIISQMADVLCNACGGLLPLLASATSASHEIEVLDNTEGLSSIDALRILKRVMSLSDLFVLANSANFSELEQEKSMPTGGILRQCLRLTMTAAVRNCMEFRFQKFDSSKVPPTVVPTKGATKDPIETILELTYLMTITDHDHDDPSNDINELIASFVKNPESVLQELDIQRLRAIIYRDVVRQDRSKTGKNVVVVVDDAKQSQFLSLAIVYFASVLMVSRYRDIIESNQPSLSRHGSIASASAVAAVRNGSTGDAHAETTSLNGSGSIPARIEEETENGSTEAVENTDSQSMPDGTDENNTKTDAPIQYSTIATIPPGTPSTINTHQLSETKLPDYPKANFNSNDTPIINITEKLERTLANIAPFLRDIFIEFAHILTKTLVGSHGQELLPGGLHALKQTASVVELVMLLCSQEWQNSLQKHAGLAFIELVNEGRLLSHASKDHVVKVANEADFILNRMRADDIRKASEFEQLCAQTTVERKEDEQMCDHFITAARQRHQAIAARLKEKFLAMMVNDKTAYLNSSRPFWKLDSWEDDLRRRRRVIRNPYGSAHVEATQKSSSSAAATNNEMNDDLINTVIKEENLLKQLKQQKTQNFNQTLPDDDEGMQVDEKDLDQDFSGPIRFSTECSLVCGAAVVHGTLSMTHNAMLFDTDEHDESFTKLDSKMFPYIDNLHGKWHFSEIRAIFSRRYLLQDKALEIFVSNRTSVMFAFNDRIIVKKVISFLPRVGVGARYGLPQQRRTSLASPKQLFRSANMTQRWQRREISNFEYLMYLNTISGRTYQDLNQYPIFPWIIADYESEKLDLNSPSTYRDLSKPVGALNPTRRAFFVERFNNWESDTIPPFHYGTHYSTAAFTLSWLIRLEPFTTFYLNLQEGKFDHANRTFHSIPVSWQNCQRDSSDVKELIPEFFSLPEMLVNCNHYKLGRTEDGLKVDDVILPKWASTPEDFIRINRAALESEFVSCHLHHWIDLIFGYKQRGPEAIRAVNVFYYLTYEGAVNLDTITNPTDRAAIETQIRNFGQAPSQLLTEPHPPRNSAMTLTPMMYNVTSEDVSMIMKFSSNAPIIHVSANTNPTLPTQAVVTISNKHDFSVNKYNPNVNPTSQPYSDSSQTAAGQQTQLPLSMDMNLVTNLNLNRRNLGDNFDERIQQRHQSFVVTADNRFIISTGYWDKSFRVQNTDMAKITQILYGHFDIVTCICRSEVTLAGNCFLATGSRDCTVCIWIWNGTKGAIVDREYPNQEINPSPAAILTGHDTEITCIWISAELGMVLSGSEHSLVLQHTLHGDILRSFENPILATPRLLCPSNDGDIVVCYDQSKLCLYTLNGKLMRQAIFEDETIQTMVLNADNQYTVIGGDRGFVQIIRTHDLQPVYAYPQCDASIRSLAITHDQKYIMAGLSTGCLIVFNVNFNVLNQPRRETNVGISSTAIP